MLTGALTRPAKPFRWSVWLTRLLYALMALGVAAILAFSIFKPIKVIPRVSLAPGFAFTNQNGERRSSEDYRGKLTVYNFAYTRCGDSCPATLQMQALRRQLSSSVSPDVKLALVTISLDPEHDTPAVLREYAAHFDAEQDSAIAWDWLTSDPQRTKYVVGGGFGVYYENEADASIQFAPRFVLVDGWSIIRAEHRAVDSGIQYVIRDIDYLTTEARNSQGAGRLAYEAAHLFRCYP
jgi:protein SCO1/2